MSHSVAIFAPSPVLTVTIEEHDDGGDLHVHAGGQGLWQARLLEAFDVQATMCAVLLGETGAVLKHLLREHEGVDVVAIERDGRGAAYVHDRRGGKRDAVMETPGDALTRHDVDELYNAALRLGLERDATILSGPAGEGVVPDEVYARLAADLRTAGRMVIADLSGDRLNAVLEGGLHLLKVSDEELIADERAADSSDAELRAAIERLREEGAERVIVTRAEGDSLAGGPEGLLRVGRPSLQVVDTRGAGDSLTAAVTAVLLGGGSFEEALRIGAAAGAVNVTRHGLGSADPDTIRAVAKLVDVHPLEED